MGPSPEAYEINSICYWAPPRHVQCQVCPSWYGPSRQGTKSIPFETRPLLEVHRTGFIDTGAPLDACDIDSISHSGPCRGVSEHRALARGVSNAVDVILALQRTDFI